MIQSPAIPGMGTELQYAFDPLATLENNNSNAVSREFRRANCWACTGQRFLKANTSTCRNRIQKSMDKSLEKYNRESVRKTMLKQEEIFREQVQELHRLYRIQKMVMAEVQGKKIELHSSGSAAPPASRSVGPACLETDRGGAAAYWSTAGTCSTPRHLTFGSSHCPATQMNLDGSFDELYRARPNTSSHELSSSYKDTVRLQRGFDLERPAREDISADASAIEDQAPVRRGAVKTKTAADGLQDHTCFFEDGEKDIELTLSIGCSYNKKKAKHRPRSDAALSCSNSTPDESRQPQQSIPSTSVRSVQEEECSNTDGASFDQGSFQRPHWLFQALSLNRTALDRQSSDEIMIDRVLGDVILVDQFLWKLKGTSKKIMEEDVATAQLEKLTATDIWKSSKEEEGDDDDALGSSDLEELTFLGPTPLYQTDRQVMDKDMMLYACMHHQFITSA
ncbi:hypothetical protein ACLOJK_030690 [Asimina triloba]